MRLRRHRRVPLQAAVGLDRDDGREGRDSRLRRQVPRAGVRLSLVFSDSDAPSNDWDVIRGESPDCWKTASEPSEQDGVASFGYLGKTASPYLTASVVENGTLSVPVDDIPSLDGAKPAYMWFYLTPEDFTGRWTMYSKKATRNYGIEGSAVVVGDSVCVTFAEGVAADPVETGFVVFHGGIGPFIGQGSSVCTFSCAVRPDANLIVEEDGSQAPSRPVERAADKAAALCRLYERLFDGKFDVPTASEPTPMRGAAFNVMRTGEHHVSAENDRPSEAEVLRIAASVLVIPFVFPTDVQASRVTLSFPSFFDGSDIAPGTRFNVFLAREYLTSLPADVLRRPGLHDGMKPPFALIGTITGGTSAAFRISQGDSRFGSLVISGFLPPESYAIAGAASQGTGAVPFLPDVSLG